MALHVERIEELRVARGLSKQDLLALAKRGRPSLSRNTLYRILKRDQEPTLDVVRALAEALETTADYLLGLTADPGIPGLADDHIPSSVVAPLVARLNSLSIPEQRELAAIFLRILDFRDAGGAEADEDLGALSERDQRWLRLLDQLTPEQYEAYLAEFAAIAVRYNAVGGEDATPALPPTKIETD
jgi:transcriptional regulator with XRE-family HTH domain